MRKKFSVIATCALISANLVLAIPTSSAAVKNSLTITYQQTPESKVQKWSLKCQPTAGTMKNAKGACKLLLAISNPFKKADPAEMCAEIFESAEVATVKGTWNGKKVSARFAKNNSCEISRWKTLNFLVQGVKTA
jgi:hypothetical protein